MKKVILITIMIGASSAAPIRWFRATNPDLGAPGWGWARFFTGIFLSIAAAAAIATLGGWLLERGAKTLNEAEESLIFKGVSQALWVIAMGIGAPVLLWWGLYLA